MKNSHFANSVRYLFGLIVLIISTATVGYYQFLASASRDLPNAVRETVSVKLKNSNNPLVNLRPESGLPTVYASADHSGERFEGESLQPLALATADFDADGFPDLVASYASAQGGVLIFHRGNAEAFAPKSEESLALIREGRFPAPFLQNAESFDIPSKPDFLVTGDFDRDGNLDAAVATRGGDRVFLLSGRGKDEGGFNVAEEIVLPGALTALAAGEIDAADKRADLLVGIENSAGEAALLVYKNAESGIFAAPTNYELNAPAISLEIGKLDDNEFFDAAILTARGVSILHGRSQNKQSKTGDFQPENINLPFAPQAIAIGDFIADRAGKTEIALLTQDGKVLIAKRGELDERPFSAQEAQAKRGRAFVKQSQPDEDGAKLKNRKIETPENWTIDGNLSADKSSDQSYRQSSAPILMKANFSGQNTDDIVFLNSETREIKILSQSGKAVDGNAYSGEKSELLSSALETESQPMAVLSMRLNVLSRPGLVVLQKGKTEPSFVAAAPSAVFEVDRVDDTNVLSAQACTSAPGDCSLRGAISKANTTPGADVINISPGTYTLTLANAGANEDSNATGDLDIKDDLTIIGLGGQAGTIIQAGTNTTNGIDKVFASNPICQFVVNTSFSGITVRYGRNTQPNGSPDFSYTGGGLDWCNTGAGGTLSITDSTFDSNSATTGPGGGIDLDTATTTSGNVTLTNVTISNNRSSNPSAGGITIPANGGGLAALAGPYNLTITNSTITGNTAQTNSGGGIYFQHISTANSVFQISGTTISNNSAFSQGGGINFVGSGTVSFTLQNSTVSGNTSGTGAGGVAQGGGIFVTPMTGSATINKTTIINNVLSSNASINRGGAGIAAGEGNTTISYNRIVGNTGAGTLGNGLNKDVNPGAANAAENWWGCSTGPSAAPCDTAVLTPGSAGSLNYTPWIVLRHTASPSTITVGQNTTLTASFLTDSANNVLSLSNITVLLGLPITFNNPVRGTISNAQTTIQSNGTATATFTATSAGAGSADAIVDNDVAAAGRTNRATITVNKAGTTTSVTSSVNPSRVGQAVNFTATIAPLSPVVPTGTVQFVIDNANFGSPVALVNGVATLSNVTSLTTGVHTVTANYSGDTNFNASNGTLSGGQTVIAAPVISKAFGASFISPNATTSLTFTLTNPNASALNDVAFTDNLPSGLKVADTPGVINNCGGTVTAAANAASISYSGGTLTANSDCTIIVNVKGIAEGQQNNTTGNVSSTNGGTGNTASASVTVINPPTLSKSFAPNQIQLNSTSVLQFTLANPNSSLSLNNAAFTDQLPNGVTAPNTAATTVCTDGSYSITSNVISFTKPSLAGGGNCQFSVTVTGTTTGMKTNTTSTVTTTNSGAGSAATAMLSVLATPDLSIGKSDGGITITPGGTVAYTLSYANSGSTLAANGVFITETVPANTTFNAAASTAGWSCVNGSPAGTICILTIGTVNNSASGSATFAVTVVNPIAAGVTQISNTASIADDGTQGADPTPTNNSASDTTPVNAAPDLTITKSDGGATTSAGGTVSYTLNFSNVGNQGATGVTLTENVPANSTFNAGASSSGWLCSPNNNAGSTCNLTIGNLNAGVSDSRMFTVTIANPLPSGVTQISNTASIADNGANGADPTPNNNSATDTTPILSPPSIAKAFSPNSISLGAVSTLTFTITNPNAGAALTGVAFTDTFPAGLEISATPNIVTTGCGSPTFAPAAGNTSLSFSGGTISASGICTVSVSVTATTVGAKVNTTGNVTSTNGGTGNNATDTLNVLSADLSITKTDGATTAVPGASVTYTITARNNGPSSTTGVTVADTFPAALSGVSWTCIGAGGATCSASGSGNINDTVNLPANGSVTYTATATVSSSATGTLSNTASVTPGDVSDPNTANNSATDTDTLTPRADLSITKTDGATSVTAGGPVVYTITASNAGPSNAAGATVTDTFPAALTGTWTCAGTGGGTCSASGLGNINDTVNLPAGASVTYTVNAVVSATASGMLSNTASVMAPATVTDPTPGNNSATDSDQILHLPIIAKAFSPTVIQPTQNSTVTLTLSNSNPFALTNASFTDNLSNMTAVGGASGGSCAGASSNVFASGAQTLSFSNITIPANSSCTLTFTVTSITPGEHPNQTSGVTTNQTTGAGAPSNTAQLIVNANAVVIGKGFTPTRIQPGGTSTVTVYLSNASNLVAATNASFTDTLVNMSAVGGPIGGTCQGTTPNVLQAGATNLSFSGITVPAQSQCTITYRVTSNKTGTHPNVLSGVSSDQNSMPGAVSNIANLTVTAPPSITKSFSPSTVSLGGISMLSFTINNPSVNVVALNDVGVEDVFPVGMQIADVPAVTSTCSNGSVSSINDGKGVFIAAATIPVNSSCTFTVNVKATQAGSLVNTTGAVTSSNGGDGNQASATLSVGQRTNVALASNGGVASASSVFNDDGAASKANDGVRVWATSGAWKDATANFYPDWLQVDFNGSKTINEIDVYAVRDDFWNTAEPMLGETFTTYGITDFDVQYWNGS
ncbi:MAG TPA: Ig-like domain repeat protein, partial [Pyrinomonadaceae bacterium]